MSARPPAPLALRLIHAVVFFGFAAATIAAANVELQQLGKVLAQPWNTGTLPLPVSVGAACIAGAAAVLFLFALLRGRSASLPVSSALLIAFLAALASRNAVVEGRSHFGGNLALVRLMDGVHAEVRAELQATGEAPSDLEAWRGRVDRRARALFPPEGVSPYRRGIGRVVPFGVQLIESADANPTGLPPGTVLVWVSGDRASFSLLGVGLDANGVPVRVRDAEGKLVEFKGAFNPDMQR